MDTFNQPHSKSIYNDIPETEATESYVDQYQEEQEENTIEEENKNLDASFSNVLERDTYDNGSFDEDDYDEDEDLDESDLDDDLIEDYDENDREIESGKQFKTETSEQFDIDQDLEEVDPVNHPREFDR
jgi:hypothetical protein